MDLQLWGQAGNVQMLQQSSFFHRFWVGNPGFGIVAVNQPVSSQWIKKGREVICHLKFLRLVSLLFFFLLFSSIFPNFLAVGFTNVPWNSSSCSLLSFLICRNIKNKTQTQRGCEATLTAQLKLNPSVCSKSWILNLPSSLQKKKIKIQKISCLMVSEAQNVLLVLVSSSKGETQNPSSCFCDLTVWAGTLLLLGFNKTQMGFNSL